VRTGRQAPGWVTDSPSLGLTSLLSSPSLLSEGIKPGHSHNLPNFPSTSQHLPTTAWRHLPSTFFCPASRYPELLYKTQQQIVSPECSLNHPYADSLVDILHYLHDANQVDLGVGCHRECTSSSPAIASMMSLSLT
jgi:hypothetical protein